MRKLVFVVVGLFALFTLIKAYTSVRAEGDKSQQSPSPVSTYQTLPSKP